MRRKDREKDKKFGLEVIEKSQYGVVSKGDYSIPLSLALKGDRLYGHGAMEGEKWKHFREGDKLRVVFVSQAQVPHPIEGSELRSISAKGEKLPLPISKIFTTNFSSAIVTGSFHTIEREEMAREALVTICKKYNMEEELLFFDRAFEMSKSRTKTFYIEIETIEAKEKFVEKFSKKPKP